MTKNRLSVDNHQKVLGVRRKIFKVWFLELSITSFYPGEGSGNLNDSWTISQGLIIMEEKIEETKKEKNKIYPNGEISDELYDTVYG